MYRSLLSQFSAYLKLNTKIENGMLVPGENNGELPKLLKKEMSEEEYNANKKAMLDMYYAYQKAVLPTVNKLTLPNGKLPFTVSQVKKAAKGMNDYLKNYSNPQDEKDTKELRSLAVKNPAGSLSSEEVRTRTKTQNDAEKILEKYIPMYNLASHLISQICKDADYRQQLIFLCVGCNGPEDVISDFEVLTSGTQEEKKKLVDRKYALVRQTAYELSVEKSDAEYMDFFYKNCMAADMLNEVDGGKMKSIAKTFDCPLPTGETMEFFDKYKTACPTLGSRTLIVGKVLNPYYTKLSDDTAKCLYELCEGNGYTYLDEDARYAPLTQIETANADRCFENGLPVARLVNKYGNNAACFNEPWAKDNLTLYLEKNEKFITKIQDEKGNTFTLDKANIDEMVEKMKEGKSYILYQKDMYKDGDRFMAKLSIPDKRISSAIRVPHAVLENVNFKANAEVSLKNIKAAVHDLDALTSSNHQEYKNLLAYVDTMEAEYKKTGGLSNICSKLRTLAADYVESKYVNCKYKKTQRTYNREDFCMKLINSIDKAYPVRTFEPLQKQQIADLDKADLKNDKFLKSVIQMNKDGVSPSEVEDKAQEMLYQTGEKTQVVVELPEDKNDDLIELKADKPEQAPVREGMSEKDL